MDTASLESATGSLFQAVRSGDEETARRLLGGDVDQRVFLMIAATNGHADIVDALIHSYNVDPNFYGADERDLLMQAALFGHVEVVKTLLKSSKVEPYILTRVNANGETALKLAITQRHTEIVEEILKRIV